MVERKHQRPAPCEQVLFLNILYKLNFVDERQKTAGTSSFRCDRRSFSRNVLFHCFQKTACTLLFCHVRRSFSRNPSFTVSKRPPASSFFAMSGGLFREMPSFTVSKRPPASSFFAMSGGLFREMLSFTVSKRPPASLFFLITGGLSTLELRRRFMESGPTPSVCGQKHCRTASVGPLARIALCFFLFVGLASSAPPRKPANRRLLAPAEQFSLQAEGPQCPFGLLFAPCHRAEGKSRADKVLNVGRNEAVGSREAGESLFTSPEHCGTRAWSKAEGVNTHRSLPGGSDGRLRGRISPRKSDKFGFVGSIKEKAPQKRSFLCLVDSLSVCAFA